MKQSILFAGMLIICAAGSIAAETAIEKTTQTVVSNSEEYTLPGGTQVTVENNTRILYRETGQNSLDKKARRVAVFVKNNAGTEFDDAVMRIRDQLVAQVSGENFEFIDYHDAVLAMESMTDAVGTADGIDQVRSVERLQGEINRRNGDAQTKNLGGTGTSMDDRLLAQSSIVALAQQLEADYILRLSLDRFDKSVKDRNFGESRWLETTYKLSASYKLMDFGGYSIGGNSLSVTRTEKKTDGDRSQMGAYADGLDEDMAAKLAKDMNANAKRWRDSSLAKSRIPVYFDTLAMSMDSQPMYMPRFDTEQEMVVMGSQVPARIAALVEVDGVVVGTTDCTVPLSPGLHKVRVHRDGQDDVTMTINAREGLQIVVPMRITEGEMKRIQSLQKFVNDLTVDRKVSEAVIKKYEGEAEMLRNSHIRIDAKNLPDTKVYKSIF